MKHPKSVSELFKKYKNKLTDQNSSLSQKKNTSDELNQSPDPHKTHEETQLDEDFDTKSEMTQGPTKSEHLIDQEAVKKQDNFSIFVPLSLVKDLINHG